MNRPTAEILVEPVAVRDPQVLELLDALTKGLARGGYGEDETFGYSADQLERTGVYLVGASVGTMLVGVAGVELADGVGELKRFFVQPEHRGSGVADALIGALVRHAEASGIGVLRLETGDKQHAAIAFYRRHGFVEVPRFGRTSAASRRCVCSALAAATTRTAEEVNEEDSAVRSSIGRKRRPRSPPGAPGGSAR